MLPNPLSSDAKVADHSDAKIVAHSNVKFASGHVNAKLATSVPEANQTKISTFASCQADAKFMPRQSSAKLNTSTSKDKEVRFSKFKSERRKT
jgi:hypothetical protein